MASFTTSLKTDKAEAGTSSTAGRPDIAYSSPPEFGGEEGKWTPEDLLLSSLEACQHLTTMFFAKKAGVNLIEYASEANSALQKTPEGLRFSEITITLKPTVASEEDKEKMVKALEMGHTFCPVGAALKVPVKLEMDVQVQA